jgi:hypothetical protein
LLEDLLGRCDLAKFTGVQAGPEDCAATAVLARKLIEETARPAAAASAR